MFLKMCFVIKLLITKINGDQRGMSDASFTVKIMQNSSGNNKVAGDITTDGVAGDITSEIRSDEKEEDATSETFNERGLSEATTALTVTAADSLSTKTSLQNENYNASMISEAFSSSVGYTQTTKHSEAKTHFENSKDTTIQQRHGPLSLQDMEELLGKQTTIRYLKSLTDEIKRTVVTEQLRYCPHTKLCTFSFNLTPPAGYISPCRACFCNSDLYMPNMLCPDILSYSAFGKLTKNDSYTCSLMYLKPLRIDRYLPVYKTVNACPNNFDFSSETRFLCSATENRNSFDNILPVTDRTKEITYKNKYCAQCHNLTLNSLKEWEPILTCDRKVEHSYSSDRELIDFVIKTPGCNLKYSPENTGAAVPVCESVISKCNISGLWKKFDHFISSACLFYENIYTVNGLPGKGRPKYRNVFCALCNGVAPKRVSIYEYESRSQTSAKIYSFSGLLKLDSSRDETPNHATECKNGFIHDFVKKACVEVHCSPLRTLKNGACEVAYKSVRGVVYIFTSYVYPMIYTNITVDPLHILSDVENKIHDAVFSDYLIRGYPYYYFTTVCYRNIHQRFSDLCSTLSTCSSSDTIRRYDLEIHFQIAEWHNFIDIIGRFSNFSRFNLSMTTDEADIYFEIEVRELEDSFLERNEPFLLNRCSSKSEHIRLTHQKSCPLIQLELTDFEWFVDRTGINFPSLKTTLAPSEFYFGHNRTSIFVCSDSYIDKFSRFSAKPTFRGFDLSTLLSLICVSVSLACLILSILTFCIFPRLRSLPGKTNLALITCLLIAQTLFLAGSYSQVPRETGICKTLGLLTHFFWLLSVFWMNICTYHVFKIFSGLDASSSAKDSKTFLHYWCYSISLSVIFISVNIFVSLISSHFNEIGYGKISCYINSEKMIAFTFGIPVGLVLTSNITMFILSIYRYLKMPRLQKDVKNERNDLIIFAKLSTLTGCTWIFGFIYSWTGINAFSYLFILMNASQGVFLFLSFVCNKRVLNMYRNKLFGASVSSGSYRTRLTDTNMTTSRVVSKQ